MHRAVDREGGDLPALAGAREALVQMVARFSGCRIGFGDQHFDAVEEPAEMQDLIVPNTFDNRDEIIGNQWIFRYDTRLRR